jgi:hypothetical protein
MGILTQMSQRARRVRRHVGYFGLAASENASGAALYQILGDIAEAGGAVGVGA